MRTLRDDLRGGGGEEKNVNKQHNNYEIVDESNQKLTVFAQFFILESVLNTFVFGERSVRFYSYFDSSFWMAVGSLKQCFFFIFEV